MNPQWQPPQRYVHRRGANHGLHIFLTLMTCGLWAFTGWPIAAAIGRKTTATVAAPPPYPYPYPQYNPYKTPAISPAPIEPDWRR